MSDPSPSNCSVYFVDLTVKFVGWRKHYRTTAKIDSPSGELDAIERSMTRQGYYGTPGRGAGYSIPSDLERACSKLEPWICGAAIAWHRVEAIKPNIQAQKRRSEDDGSSTSAP